MENPSYEITSLDLLDKREVLAIPGVAPRFRSLPEPDINLGSLAPKGEKADSHHYWYRSTIVQWLASFSTTGKRVLVLTGR